MFIFFYEQNECSSRLFILPQLHELVIRVSAEHDEAFSTLSVGNDKRRLLSLGEITGERGAEATYANGLGDFCKCGIHTPIVHVRVQNATAYVDIYPQ